MDPVIDNEWLACKNDPVDENHNVGNIARSWQWRERGIDPPHYPSSKTVLENIAEDILVQKPLKIKCCDLPGYPRSTFLMVFSPDGTKVASTHGNHNIYVSELSSGKHVRILRGHPRTPWCIAFHPSHTQLIGSGCLGGQVRVWDISSGGSEVWNVRNETVIASIAFHPREQLLVIATYNELYFWDWSQPAPFTRVTTNNINEKVRYVAFDPLGYKLITGISLSANAASLTNTILQQQPIRPTNNQNNRRDDADDASGGNRPPENPGSAQDMIVNSYQNLVQRYDSLVRNYQRLFMVRHRLTNTPPPPSTIDRGTDPMETDVTPSTSGVTRKTRPSTSTAPQDDASPGPSTSGRQDAADSGDGEGSSSRLLNLDVLSFDSDPSRNEDESRREHSIFGSRSSAFQPLTEGRSFRTVDQSERSTRLLPNPFSSTSGTRPRTSLSDGMQQSSEQSTNTARTSIFTSLRPESSFEREFLIRRRNSSPSHHNQNTAARTVNMSLFSNDVPSAGRDAGRNANSPRQSTPSTSSTNTTERPTMTNSSTQMSPVSAGVDAQTINESLDLIRDILRDSGTRLLNLITNMSISTLANVERNMPRRGSRAQSDDSEGSGLSRGGRPRVRLFTSNLRRDFVSSSSDSDSDQSLEVNIFRTRNSTFREEESRDTERPAATSTFNTLPTDRLVFELNDESRNEATSQETGGINVSLSNDRFHVRTQNNSASENPSTSQRDNAATTDNTSQNTTTDFNPNRPSTSRDGMFSRSSLIPPEEAYRKVRGGVNALQKHTMQLTNLWLRGSRTTMRELRNMWENLRRRVMMLHRETGRQDIPSYYTRSLLERCMMLTEITESTRASMRLSRNAPRSEGSERNVAENREGNTESTINSTAADGEAHTSTSNISETRPTPMSRPNQPRTSTGVRSSPSLRRRLQSSYRWRPEDELRRRSRNPGSNRLTPRYNNRSRRDFARAIEISATRHEIRMRAMQVLSVMFNMMMMCLEERGLSQLIINMLRTLKKALAVTCLMLMTNRNTGRSGSNPAASGSRVESLNVVRIQNVDHFGPVNVDGPDEPASPSTANAAAANTAAVNTTAANTAASIKTTTPTNAVAKPTVNTEDNTTNKNNVASTSKIETPSTSQGPQKPQTTSNEHNVQLPTPSTSASSITQSWSNRVAVQIADANRNTSVTARNRREMYLERKRQKALHKTNPSAHPINKKKVMPPVSTYRIPALRYVPSRLNLPKFSTPCRLPPPASPDPVAGPSTSDGPPLDNLMNRSPNDERMLNEFEHRVNLIRLAHIQAVRLRNAARTRFRRLQTIRLYTPSSVREMFDLQSNNADHPPGSRSPLQNGPELGNRRSFATYRPHILTPRTDAGNRTAEEPGHFHAVLNNVAMPLMQVNDMPANSDSPASPPHRVPRIHEYLQPIILAQNAMVVDEDGGEPSIGGGPASRGGPGGAGGALHMGPRRIQAGMAGLLDAGIISEALPSPSHRVQAWDFTKGDTPDIADSTKNVVVQRCRIHNDASIDISKDGRLLVALLPVPRLRNTNHWLGVYSLEWSQLGACVHTAMLEQSAVSVALSPTARHLAVGLGSRRFTTTPHARNNVFALLYRLDPFESSSRAGLSPIKELEQNWEHGFTSLNCLRWAPQPGQGLVYANNTGQLIIMS